MITAKRYRCAKFERIGLKTFPAVGRSRHGVFLEGYDIDRELCERLAQLIEETWRRIPERDRKPLTKLWCTGDDIGLGISFRVLEVLRATDQYRHEYLDSPKIEAFAECTRDGNFIRFWAPYVRYAHDQAVQALIAHEIAHAVLRALALEYDSDEHEHHDTRRLTFEWGFNEDLINDAWRKGAPKELQERERRAARRRRNHDLQLALTSA
jgi:hypothetical protein